MTVLTQMKLSFVGHNRAKSPLKNSVIFLPKQTPNRTPFLFSCLVQIRDFFGNKSFSHLINKYEW